MAHPLVTHSKILSTFQDGGQVKFPTLGIAVMSKSQPMKRLTKSNSLGLPDPPILGQTIDMCITPPSSSSKTTNPRGYNADEQSATGNLKIGSCKGCAIWIRFLPNVFPRKQICYEYRHSGEYRLATSHISKSRNCFQQIP